MTLSRAAAALATTDTSTAEALLRDDPSHDYARMDAASQALYHEAVDEIAARARCDGRTVATMAIKLAIDQCAVTRPGDVTRHVGYFLVAEGRPALLAALSSTPIAGDAQPHQTWTVAWFSGTIIVGGLLLGAVALRAFRPGDLSLGVAVLSALLLFLQGVGRTTIIASMLAGVARPRHLPRLDFTTGIPSECLTAVCVPTLVTDREHVAAIAATLERHWHAIHDDGIRMVLLTDWPDADHADPTDDETALLDELTANLDRLNDSYGRDGTARFYLLHRPRRYSPTERCWMGWERKRGKLLEFNRLVAEGVHGYDRVVGDLTALRRVIYAVVADDDTTFAPEAVQMLVATIAHPVARLQRLGGPEGTLRGLGAIAPDVSPIEKADGRDRGLAPREWPRKVDFDLFGECAFPGQGLYDVRWAHRQLARRFPEGCVLSHDVVESGFLRCGFSERALFIERGPRTYRLFNERWHRWMRGDCQNVWVMCRLLRNRTGDGGRPRLVQWFWVALNIMLILPRLTLACLLAIAIFSDPALADRRFLVVMALDLVPDAFTAAFRTFGTAWRAGRLAPRPFAVVIELLKLPYIAVVRIASVLYGALMRVDAIVSVVVRILTGRRLLAWVSSSHLDREGMHFYRLDMYSYLAPGVALLGAIWLSRTRRASVSGLGVLLLTAFWPVVVWLAHRIRKQPAVTHSR